MSIVTVVAFFAGGLLGAIGMALACLTARIDDEQGTR